jgi:biopolymer transport protein ExbD
MFRKAFARDRSDGYAEVMLTSCIDLFMAIISFLLMCAAFFQIRVINASVPTISDAPLEAGQSEKELNVVLQMDEAGFNISGNGDSLSAAEVASVRTTIPKTAGQFDRERLTNILRGIKWKFPRGKTLLMVPDKTIPYNEIVLTLDSARWGKPKDPATVPQGGPVRDLLYSNVVLSSLVEEVK